MAGTVVLHHALLGMSVLALGGAAVRCASPLAERGLARVIAAVTFATAGVVIEALVLGLFGAGGSAVALALAAFAAWVAARLLLPAPVAPLTGELGSWWRGRTLLERLMFAALLGACGAWTAWQLRHPALGGDMIAYHLPEMVLWVQQGTPGSIETVIPGVYIGNYPVTTEVVIAWAMGIARSFVPIVLVPWTAAALTVVAGWAGLRALRVPPVPRALAVAAVCTTPWLLAWQQGGTVTDPVALAFLVACAALCVLSRERPELLAAAVVAGGLSFGAKTTTLPLTLLTLALGLYANRRRLGGMVTPLVLSSGVALGAGGVWYIRDLVTHGSPFWPIVAAPWGDPVPRSIAVVHSTFLGHPGRTIDRIGQMYLDHFGGALLLLAAGALAALVVPRRRVALASATVVAGFVLWASSPVTGAPSDPAAQGLFAFSATRYLLPVIAVAALALALAAVENPRRAWASAVVLAAVTCINVVQTFDLGGWLVPSARVPLAGAVIGGLLAVAIGFVVRPSLRARVPSAAAGPAAAALVVAAAAALAVPATGFLERHAQTNPDITGRVTSRLANDPVYRTRSARVESAFFIIGPLAGDRLQHRLALLPPRASCGEIAARARAAWLIVSANPAGLTTARVAGCLRAVPSLQAPYAVFAPRGAS